MSYKPILFSAPMVQAILEGRKTMTRRVIKPQPVERDENNAEAGDVVMRHGELCKLTQPRNAGKYLGWLNAIPLKQRYQKGNILWVRETWTAMRDMENGYTDYFYAAERKDFATV